MTYGNFQHHMLNTDMKTKCHGVANIKKYSELSVYFCWLVYSIKHLAQLQ